MSLESAAAVAVQSWHECEVLNELVPRFRGCEICDHGRMVGGSLCCDNPAFAGAHTMRVATARGIGMPCGPEAAFQRRNGVLLR